ncbi:hypothetical protein OTU49_004443, partial [Cherax quadricarinatus]
QTRHVELCTEGVFCAFSCPYDWPRDGIKLIVLVDGHLFISNSPPCLFLPLTSLPLLSLSQSLVSRPPPPPAQPLPLRCLSSLSTVCLDLVFDFDAILGNPNTFGYL